MDVGRARPLVDEQVALWAAAAVARPARSDPSAAAKLRAAIDQDLPLADEAVRRWSRLGASDAEVSVRLVGRSGWVRRNLVALRGLFEPVRERIENRPAVAQALGLQLGCLFGALSSKVLGQYVLPIGGEAPGELVVVGPNMLELQQRYGGLADDIRRAVLVHELIHLHQFAASPWLADHLRVLVERYMADARVDRERIAELFQRLPETIAEVRRKGTVRPVLETVLTESQAAVVDEAQGLMSLLEGHANAAMFDAGNGLVTDPSTVRKALEARRRDVTSRLLAAFGGMELKRRQYREGEKFVRAILDHGGPETLNMAFRDPGSLPGSAEVAAPQAWLERVRAT